MTSYINTARHAITLPNGRPVGAGEQFDYDGPLDDEPLAGWFLNISPDEPVAEEQGTDQPHDRPPPSPDTPGVQQNQSVESSEAFDAGRMVLGPPPDDEPAEGKPKRSTRKRGET